MYPQPDPTATLINAFTSRRSRSEESSIFGDAEPGDVVTVTANVGWTVTGDIVDIDHTKATITIVTDRRSTFTIPADTIASIRYVR